MTLTINYTDLNTRTNETVNLTASNFFMMNQRFNALDRNGMYVESWKAETKEWNAGNAGRNAEVYLMEFLAQ